MAENSNIEWCHHTNNLFWGCVSTGIGCDNCYAEVLSHRWGKDLWGNDKPRMETKSWAKDLVKYNKKAFEINEFHRVFVGSMMDIFEKEMPLINHLKEKLDYNTIDVKNKLFNEIVPITPNLIYLFLTKRPSNINKQIPESWKIDSPKNVMFGTSPVNQETADKLIPQILEVNGKIFLSVEPMLDKIILKTEWLKSGKILQIICGGESGHGKRPFNPDWARSIRDQCKEFNIPFFMKQWDKVKEIPEDLMIREFPELNLI